MDKLIFREHLLRHWLPWEPCPKCREKDRPLVVYFPEISVGAVYDTIHFRTHCALCQHHQPVHVRLQRLRLGLMLLRDAEIAIKIQLFRRNLFQVIEPGVETGIDPQENEYPRLVLECARLMRGPGSSWEALATDPAAWEEFLRRLGMPNDKDPE